MGRIPLKQACRYKIAHVKKKYLIILIDKVTLVIFIYSVIPGAKETKLNPISGEILKYLDFNENYLTYKV